MIGRGGSSRKDKNKAIYSDSSIPLSNLPVLQESSPLGAGAPGGPSGVSIAVITPLNTYDPCNFSFVLNVASPVTFASSVRLPSSITSPTEKLEVC